MRVCSRITYLLAALALAWVAQAGEPAATAPAKQDLGDVNSHIREMTQSAHLVIVGTGTDFPALKRDAQRIATLMGRSFSMQGMVYDGTLHANGEDDGFTGYFCRRYDSESDGIPYLSIEKSGAYPGLKPGLYIIVARICDTPKAARREVQAMRKFVPDAYTRKTEIYYGCRH
jgi:hypothetical protein